jgi:diguanylate cyclase (GGDEF)-like protein
MPSLLPSHLIADPAATLPPERLLGIIRFQTEIAKVGLDLAVVIERVALLAQLLTGGSGAVVELAEGEEMVYRAASGIAERQLGLRLARRGSLSGLCVEQGVPLRCEDSETDARVDREACRLVGLRSMIVVPLRHGDLTVGVLKVLSAQPAAFQDAELLTLELISEVVASALVHATRYSTQVETARDLFLRATRDSLTGLGNRALFYDRLHQGLKLARRHGHSLGIALVDMDGLKRINDEYGHQAGDAALRILAERLRALTRESDTLARLGGDEFGILLAAVKDPAAARDFAHKLADQVQGTFSFDGMPFDLSASVGTVVFPEDGGEVEALLHQADLAMYEMKRARGAMRAAKGR